MVLTLNICILKVNEAIAFKFMLPFYLLRSSHTRSYDYRVARFVRNLAGVRPDSVLPEMCRCGICIPAFYDW